MEKNRRLPFLSIVQISDPEFERFLIKDQAERVWTGTQFGSGEPLLYADPNDAALDVQNILKSHFVGVQPVKYVVPCFIEVRSHDPLSPVEVAQYLSKASRLLLNTMDHGNGPGDSLVLPWIDWNKIREEIPNE